MAASVQLGHTETRPDAPTILLEWRDRPLEPRERPGHEIVVAHRTGPPRMPDELRAILGAGR